MTLVAGPSDKWSRLIGDDYGTAVTEFGMIAPVLLLLLLGMFDLSHTAYAHAVFQGAVERAARESSLETGDIEVADQMVSAMIRPVLPDADLEAERRSYFDFADIDRPEQFEDENGNDVCDNGESYVDENNSGEWDEDIGVSGNGGAGDVVVYTVTATYDALFQVPFAPSSWNTRSMTATAVKKNQPFSNQQDYVTVVAVCSDE